MALAVGLAVGACKKKKKATPPAGSQAPQPKPAKKIYDPKQVARGRYLAEVVMNCGGCHTRLTKHGVPDRSKYMAGGLEIPEPFGTWRSPNITPARRTGIGDWTDAQIITAIREGKRPDGSRLYPIMPYPNYNKLSDTDAQAVVAFLRSLPATENMVRGNTALKLPKFPVPPPAGKGPSPGDLRAYGEYLATLAHCNQCHTPMTPKGMPDRTKPYAGGMHFEIPVLGTGRLYAANITPDKKTGIGTWTDAQITTAITSLRKRDGKPIVGPMAISGANWSRLRPRDVKAMVTFLRGLKPIRHKVPKSTFKPRRLPPPK